MHVFLDRFSIEAFLNDGDQVMSAAVLTELAAQDISFHAIGEAEMDVVMYELCLEEEA